MGPLQWMGAVRMRVQTADKNITITHSFSPHKPFIDGLEWCGVVYLWIIVMFLSAVWTLILTAPIHCRWSIGEQVMLKFSKSVLMKKLTPLGWPTFNANFHFGGTFFKCISVLILYKQNKMLWKDWYNYNCYIWKGKSLRMHVRFNNFWQ